MSQPERVIWGDNGKGGRREVVTEVERGSGVVAVSPESEFVVSSPPPPGAANQPQSSSNSDINDNLTVIFWWCQ